VSLIPMDLAHIQVMLQNDAQQMRTMLSWLEERNRTYQQNLTAANMTAAGITTADQTAILAFIADIARMLAYASGTPQAIAGDVRIDITGVLGVM
jgi:hypothetical protein